MMKKRIVVGLMMTAAAAAGICGMARQKEGDERKSTLTAREAFVALPAGYLEILSKNTRLDMLDYWDNDSIYHASNNLQGEAWLDTVSPAYLRVHPTAVSTLEVETFTPRKGPQLVVATYTVGTPDERMDSDVSVFDTEMNPLHPVQKYLKIIEKEKSKK